MSESRGATVYTSTHCVFCGQLKQYLKDQDIAFEEKNVDTNDQFAEELEQLGYRSVPVTVIGGTAILGMNPTRIQQAIAALA